MERERTPESEAPVDLSVLFSTRDRADTLERTLAAMSRLEPGDLRWELIVIDNGSSDRTAEVLSAAAGRLPIRVLHEPVPGKNRCLNLGVSRAGGSLLVFTDDDVLPRADWLTAYAEAAGRWPDDSVFSGRIRLDFPPGTPAWIPRLPQPYLKFAFSLYDHDRHEGPIKHSPTGPNMAVRRSVFDRFSFNESIGPAGKNYAMGSETELLIRLRDAGHRFIYVPDSRVKHIIREEQATVGWLASRGTRLGRGQMASSLIQGHNVRPLLWRSLTQGAVALPLLLLSWLLPPAWRFRSRWHWNKAVGRVVECWASR